MSDNGSSDHEFVELKRVSRVISVGSSDSDGNERDIVSKDDAANTSKATVAELEEQRIPLVPKKYEDYEVDFK